MNTNPGRIGLVFLIITLVLAAGAITGAGAGPNADHKMAIHVLPRETRTCTTNFPALSDCGEIVSTYGGCGDIDIFPVLYDVSGIRGAYFGLTWPEEWGTCSFVICSGEATAGSIVYPGDGVEWYWEDCTYPDMVAMGYGHLTASTPGTIELVDYPVFDHIGVLNCDQDDEFNQTRYKAGVCGRAGDDPCVQIYLPLGLSKADDTAGGCASEGDTLVYTILYDNAANSVGIDNVVLIDELDEFVGFLSASGGGTYNASTHAITWDLGTLPAGGSGSTAVSVEVLPGVSPGGSLINAAEIAGSNVPETSFALSTPVCGAGIYPLGLNKTIIDPTTPCIYPIESVDYEIHYDNYANGSSIHNVILRDFLSEWADLHSWSPGAVYDAESHSIIWNLGTLDPGEAGMVEIRVTVWEGPPPGTDIVNLCQLSSDEAPLSSDMASIMVCTDPGDRNPNWKAAVHIMPHASRTCSKNFPVIMGCDDIATTYAETGDIDFFPVLFDLNAVTAFGFGVMWPAEWGTCAYVPCAGELHIGGIVEPGDGIASSWTDCHFTSTVVAGFGWLNLTGPGEVYMAHEPDNPDIWVASCEFYEDTPVAVFVSRVGGAPGDDPCQTVRTETTTWGSIKAMFR